MPCPRGKFPVDWNGVGWFKATIKIDSTLYGKEMGLMGRIYGAMEINVNGEHIGNAGRVGDDQETEVTVGYFDPVFFMLDDSEYQHIAVRYSNHISGFLIPIGYSVYLARKIALTNKNLEQKLEENKRLSEEKLKVEQEKQRLSNRQKEELENEVAERTSVVSTLKFRVTDIKTREVSLFH